MLSEIKTSLTALAVGFHSFVEMCDGNTSSLDLSANQSYHYRLKVIQQLDQNIQKKWKVLVPAALYWGKIDGKD